MDLPIIGRGLFTEWHITTYIVKPLSRMNKSLDSLIAPLFIDVSRIQRVPWNLNENIISRKKFYHIFSVLCKVVFMTQWRGKVWRHVTMVTKSLDLNNLSWQIKPFALCSDGRIVWATVLFMNAIMHRKVMHINFLGFFCHVCRTTLC